MVTAVSGRSLVALNTSTDTTEMLKVWFEMHGMIVHTGLVSDFRVQTSDIDQFLERANPDVVIFDVSIPYETNWQFLQRLRDNGPLHTVPVIVTTTNERILRGLVGSEVPLTIHELIGKPYDMGRLLELVSSHLAPSH